MSLDHAFSSFAFAVVNGVAQITLNRPDKRNCLTRAFWTEWPRALALAESKPEVRCVLLVADGPIFSAGIDLAVLQQLCSLGEGLEASRRGEHLRRTVLSLQHSINATEACPLPVIAAVQGACLGGALDLICAADLRLAEQSASFQPLEVDLGFVPDLGTVQRLSHSLPPALVNDWLMSCQALRAERALRFGFISRLAESAEELRDLALQTAADLARRSPQALRGIKETARYTRDHGIHASLRYTAAWQSGVFPGADLEEALQARQQGRAPRFANLAADLATPGAWDVDPAATASSNETEQ